ncbi:undecaprenyl-diphosphatase [Lichenihabitans psoromatis]|uniref:undecaprenyl-diphosphatase n=1 Tax=Lichenihabitans psoromatis TaxID=2528642 RepID=UPI0010384893|nr:undecaprenyl-diphosphatase [Lichenihabitans psoromatis]
MPPADANQMVFQWLSVPDPTGATLFWLSALAQWPVFGLPVLLIGLWLFGSRPNREASVLAGITGCVALLAAHVVSTLIDHPRPFMVGLAANLLDHAPDNSFPSDHATLLFATAAAFAFRPFQRTLWLGVAVATVGLAVGWARVALGVHFPFDIFGAAFIAGLSEILVTSRAMRLPLFIVMKTSETIRDGLPLSPDDDTRSLSKKLSIDAHPDR